MIDELVRFKELHYPDDQRRILSCGIPDGKIRVEWLAAAAPGVDSKWEMRLYGLVRSGAREKAIQFLQETAVCPEMMRQERSWLWLPSWALGRVFALDGDYEPLVESAIRRGPNLN